jgi:hypothetical protein
MNKCDCSPGEQCHVCEESPARIAFLAKKLAVKCDCGGTGYFKATFSHAGSDVECPAHHPGYQTSND